MGSLDGMVGRGAELRPQLAKGSVHIAPSGTAVSEYAPMGHCALGVALYGAAVSHPRQLILRVCDCVIMSGDR